MSIALSRDQAPEYLCQLDSSAAFLRHMRDKHKPGSPQHAQFQSELNSCMGQITRIKMALRAAKTIS